MASLSLLLKILVTLLRTPLIRKKNLVLKVEFEALVGESLAYYGKPRSVDEKMLRFCVAYIFRDFECSCSIIYPNYSSFATPVKLLKELAIDCCSS